MDQAQQMYSGDGLNAIYFTDLLLSEGGAFHKIGGSGEFKPVPEVALDDAKMLYELCSETALQDSRIEYKGVTYRSSRMHTVGGLVFALRRPMLEVPKLAKLGYHPALTKRLVANAPPPDGIQHGLVIICGMTCSGKTTSAGAIIVERLTQHGGLAVTIEDPPELPLQGFYGPEGRGRCYQCADISEIGGVASAGASVLRFGSPDIVMYGEIRDGKAAAEAIRAALSGHLIVITLHSFGIKEAIERLVAFATETIGLAACLQLAAALTCVIHQRLEWAEGSEKLQLYADTLFATDGIRAKIREQQLHTLETEIAQQKTLMLFMPREKK
ncbi:MAG: ATPase, T2SS/T4P/T4SS family [Methylobacter sp.]|jgi:twitching motility protein PilT